MQAQCAQAARSAQLAPKDHGDPLEACLTVALRVPPAGLSTWSCPLGQEANVTACPLSVKTACSQQDQVFTITYPAFPVAPATTLSLVGASPSARALRRVPLLQPGGYTLSAERVALHNRFLRRRTATITAQVRCTTVCGSLRAPAPPRPRTSLFRCSAALPSGAVPVCHVGMTAPEGVQQCVGRGAAPKRQRVDCATAAVHTAAHPRSRRRAGPSPSAGWPSPRRPPLQATAQVRGSGEPWKGSAQLLPSGSAALLLAQTRRAAWRPSGWAASISWATRCPTPRWTCPTPRSWAIRT
jgi:hypothetical protein